MRFSWIFPVLLALMPVAYTSAAPFSFPSDASLNTQHIKHPHLPTMSAVNKAAITTRGKLTRMHVDLAHAPKFPKFPPQPSAHVDFNEVIKNANRVKHVIAHPNVETPNLLVFVSFSMPKASLTRLARQAMLVGANVLLRGLVADAHGKPSFHATAIEVGKLDLKRGQGFTVNPMTFRRFNITQVPAFVLLTQKDCVTCGRSFVPKHLKLAGDVSLGYALREMKTRKPSATSHITPYLKRLKAGFFNGGRR